MPAYQPKLCTLFLVYSFPHPVSNHLYLPISIYTCVYLSIYLSICLSTDLYPSMYLLFPIQLGTIDITQLAQLCYCCPLCYALCVTGQLCYLTIYCSQLRANCVTVALGSRPVSICIYVRQYILEYICVFTNLSIY